VYLCHSLGIRVVAEFTENKEIVELLADLKVDYFQGYYFEKPAELI
jgi:EAL domain-containing protein (putative c-di-GMP-specific phosphodiesterase class I)